MPKSIYYEGILMSVREWRANVRVTSMQMISALNKKGLLNSVLAWIDDPETSGTAKLAWNSDMGFSRQCRLFREFFPQRFEMSEDDIDELFILASGGELEE